MLAMNTISAYRLDYGYLVRASLDGHHAAKFPKFVRAKDGTLYTQQNTREPRTWLDVSLTPEKGNATNEAGAKRLKRFLAVCEAEGIALEDTQNAKNSVSIHDVLAII